jgi:hypothetical protein
MIIRGNNNNNNDRYCTVHEVVHTDARQYEICDYCLKHKRWMYPRVVYYRYGFAKRDILMCDDCHKIESEFYEFRLITVVTESNAYEAICQVIKEKTSSSSSSSFLLCDNNNRSLDNKQTGNGLVVIDYYDAVRIAYQNSVDVREYLNCVLEDINKDLKIIWKFTYRILNFEHRIKVVNKDDVIDNLLVSWIDK